MTFSPYRPHLLSADLAFFDLAREAGFQVEKLFEEMMPEVMFPDDRGDEEVRRKVFGYGGIFVCPPAFLHGLEVRRMLIIMGCRYTLTWPPSPE